MHGILHYTFSTPRLHLQHFKDHSWQDFIHVNSMPLSPCWIVRSHRKPTQALIVHRDLLGSSLVDRSIPKGVESRFLCWVPTNSQDPRFGYM